MPENKKSLYQNIFTATNAFHNLPIGNRFQIPARVIIP
jgi:hypothetical protein